MCYYIIYSMKYITANNDGGRMLRNGIHANTILTGTVAP